MKVKNGKSTTELIMMAAGIILLGSIWGLLECTLGGVKWGVSGLYVSMGAVMAGFFGIGFMLLARRLFRFTGSMLLVALVASIMRLIAPVGVCVLCSAIAIAVEGAVFEMILSRRSIHTHLSGGKVLPMISLGVVSGFAIFVTGYLLTQILTPLVTGGPLVMGNVIGIIPLMVGRSFYAAVLGGISVPLIASLPNPHIYLNKVNRGAYLTATTALSVLSWVLVIFVIF